MAYGGLLLLAVVVLFVVILVLAFTTGNTATYGTEVNGKTIFIPGGANTVLFKTGSTPNALVLVPRTAGTLIRITNHSGAAIKIQFNNQGPTPANYSLANANSILLLNLDGASTTNSWNKVGAPDAISLLPFA